MQVLLRRLTLIGLLLLLPHFVHASTSRYQRADYHPTFKPNGATQFGVKLGRGSCTLTGYDIGDDTESGPAFNAGIFMTWWMTDNLAMQSELYYVEQTGIQNIATYYYDPSFWTGGFKFYTNKIEWTLDYIEVPVLLRWSTAENARDPQGKLVSTVFEPFFEFGLSGSVLLSQEAVDHIIEASQEIIQPEHVNWGAASFSMLVGMGTDFRLPAGIFSMQIRFRASFATIGNDADNVQHSTISFMAGYAMRVK